MEIIKKGQAEKWDFSFQDKGLAKKVNAV